MSLGRPSHRLRLKGDKGRMRMRMRSLPVPRITATSRISYSPPPTHPTGGAPVRHVPWKAGLGIGSEGDGR